MYFKLCTITTDLKTNSAEDTFRFYNELVNKAISKSNKVVLSLIPPSLAKYLNNKVQEMNDMIVSEFNGRTKFRSVIIKTFASMVWSMKICSLTTRVEVTQICSHMKLTTRHCISQKMNELIIVWVFCSSMTFVICKYICMIDFQCLFGLNAH